MRITKAPAVRRQEIIDAARKLFETKGISKTSMNEIAESIGVAKGLVYYYFSSKEELVELVVDQFIAGVDAALTGIMNDKQLDFYAKFTAILELYFNAIPRHPAIFSLSPGDPGVFSLIRDRLSGIALNHAKILIRLGSRLNLLQIEYPEYMLKILIKGLGDLYIEGIRDLRIHITLIEQILGIEKGRLAPEPV